MATPDDPIRSHDLLVATVEALRDELLVQKAAIAVLLSREDEAQGVRHAELVRAMRASLDVPHGHKDEARARLLACCVNPLND